MDNLWSAARKESVDGAARAESGRAFQSTTVLGNNNNNNNNTVISIALFTDRPGALTTSDVCSTK